MKHLVTSFNNKITQLLITIVCKHSADFLGTGLIRHPEKNAVLSVYFVGKYRLQLHLQNNKTKKPLPAGNGFFRISPDTYFRSDNFSSNATFSRSACNRRS